MSPVLLGNLQAEDLLRLWWFLVTNYPLGFIIAAAVSLVSFVGLVLVPAVDSYGRTWEKLASSFMSLFVLMSLVAIGTAVGLLVFYYSNDIVNSVP